MEKALHIALFLFVILTMERVCAQAPDISYQTPFSFTVGVPVTPVSPSNNTGGGPVPATVFSQVTTFAGSTAAGNNDGLSTGAKFNKPKGLVVDGAGNLYVADGGNNLIRKITPAGLVTTLAGSGADGSADGIGILASFSEPTGLAIDKQGNLFVTDRKSHTIRKVTPAGVVTTIAGKAGLNGTTNAQGQDARFNNPTAIAVDDAGFLYVADFSNNMIRGIAPDGSVRTIAGSTNPGKGVTSDADKQGTAATFRGPSAIAVTPDGKTIYVGEQSFIRTIDVGGNVVTVVGSFFSGNYDGTFKGARVNQPLGITIDAANTLFIGDDGNNLVRRFDSQGQVTTLAGFTGGYADGIGAAARFRGAAGVAILPDGTLYVADPGNNCIRRVITTGYYITPELPPGLNFDPKTGTISGTPTSKLQASPFSVFAYNTTGKTAVTIVIEVRLPGLIKQTITFPPLPAKKERDIDFDANATSSNSSGVPPITFTSSDTQVATITDGKIHILGPGTTTITAFQAGTTDYEEAVPVSQDLIVAADPLPIKYPTVNPKGPPIVLALPAISTYKAVLGDVATIVADPAEQPPVVILGNANFDCSSVGAQVISVTAGYGPDPANPINAEFNAPSNLTIDAQGNIFIADQGNYMLRELSAANRVTTFAGSGQPGYKDGKNTVAQFYRELRSMANDINGNVYVCDIVSKQVRKISPKGDVSSFAANALKAANGGIAADPRAIVVSPSGSIFIADQTKIYQVSADGANATVFAGSNTPANVDGIGTSAGFSGIVSLTFDQSGNMFVATYDNSPISTVRKVTPNADVTLITSVSATSVRFAGIVVDSKGGIYVSASDHNIYKINNGLLSSFVGSTAGDADGKAKNAMFNNPQGIAIDAADNIYVADTDNHKIKKVTPSGIVTTIAGNGLNGRVDNTSVSNAQTTNVNVNVTSPILFAAPFPDVSVPLSSTCAATMPDFTATAKAISFCTANVTIKQSPAAGTPMALGVPVTVTLTADDDLNPLDRATATFKVTATSSSPPTVKISPEGGVGVCDGTAASFTATYTNAGAAPTLQWQVNGINVPVTTATFTSATLLNNDKVTCIVTNNDGCAPVSAISAPAIVDLLSASVTTISIAASDDAVCPGSQVTFTATTTGEGLNDAPAYQWQINNIAVGTNSPTYSTTSLANGDVVTCVLASGGQCLINPLLQSNEIIARIKSEAECAIVITNTFTPNGDGVNDLWAQPVLANYPNCTVQVYNRYGKKVFQSTGYRKPWDGEYDGKLLPSGTYYYLIDTKTGIPALSGSVTIIR